jgi:hypothetical protein
MFRAAAALPSNDREVAIAGLRGQLHVMATAAGAVPDWSTLDVEGPVAGGEITDAGWSEWAATVTVAVGAHHLSDSAIDALVSARSQWIRGTSADTAPLARP